ncbi:peptidoglycan bridge formation glycyltransferase FemA/FemB family protein [Bacillus sp. USDA818B3_A]|uniref:peptidoglycan bridge formation glycyltransferase FemA/FemB family protein n=1 Tax=Bacillus sp. USDA818B3_A TaxID=2698834 RepID=UPI00136E04AF|nr:peptidoglycan bridge formation glycyltransferase FemA/FemB family protein [Bacillus sp. USDA818B3_A]
MAHFDIIEQQDYWKGILKNFNNIDCYYSYEYGNLFAKNENGKLFAAYYQEEDTRIFYPFIKRRVPFAEEELYDIVTPYGYGGPFIQGDEAIVKNFYPLFSSYCQLHNIITETIRCHPFYQNYRYLGNLLDIDYIRKTTSVDLRASLDEIRQNYSGMNKRNIKKAINNNLTCFVAENNQSNINTFIELYHETMDRNHAASYYYFDEEYFFNQVQDTDLSETFLLFTSLNNEIIAGVMVLVGKEFSHYHLGASKTKYLDFKPNNLLFDYMIEFCRSKGSKQLHLGGGYQENDGLFKFKTSFTNQNNYDYFIGKKVHNETAYNKIINQLNLRYEFDENYFPCYRGKMEPRNLIRI